MTQRIQRHPFLAIFDGADPSTSTPVRPTSTTPVQALFLLNDPLIHGQAERVAERVFASAGDDTARTRFMYAFLFSRAAEDNELIESCRFLTNIREKLRAAGTTDDRLEKDSWRSLVRAMFRLNEFVYVD